MATQHYQVWLEWDSESDAWVTYVPALNGLSTFGETKDEALANTEGRAMRGQVRKLGERYPG